MRIQDEDMLRWSVDEESMMLAQLVFINTLSSLEHILAKPSCLLHHVYLLPFWKPSLILYLDVFKPFFVKANAILNAGIYSTD
jgi:hypothetical protein